MTQRERIVSLLIARFAPIAPSSKRIPRISFNGQDISPDRPHTYRSPGRIVSRPSNHTSQWFDSVGPSIPPRIITRKSR